MTTTQAIQFRQASRMIERISVLLVSMPMGGSKMLLLSLSPKSRVQTHVFDQFCETRAKVYFKYWIIIIELLKCCFPVNWHVLIHKAVHFQRSGAHKIIQPWKGIEICRFLRPSVKVSWVAAAGRCRRLEITFVYSCGAPNVCSYF
jgi:hypothetical protein